MKTSQMVVVLDNQNKAFVLVSKVSEHAPGFVSLTSIDEPKMTTIAETFLKESLHIVQ